MKLTFESTQLKTNIGLIEDWMGIFEEKRHHDPWF